ncbi:MAG: ATP-binding protein [Myxococcales bacterium]
MPLDSLLRSNLVGFVLADGGHIVEANDACLALLGYSRKDLEEGHFTSAALQIAKPPQDFMDVFERVGRDGPADCDVVRKDGGWIQVLLGTITVPSDPRTLVFFIDQSQRSLREAEKEALYAHEHLARADAEDAQKRLELLVELSSALASSLDFSETITRVARLVVREFTTWCGVDLLDRDGTIRPLASAHADPEQAPFASELRHRILQSPNRDAFLLRTGEVHAGTTHPGRLSAVLGGEPQVLAPEFFTKLRGVLADPIADPLFDRLTPTSGVSVAMRARGKTLGLITFLRADTQVFSPLDITLAKQIAERGGMAIDNARLYEDAQRAVRARDELIANVSHELRNPLNGITLGARVIQRARLDLSTADTIRDEAGEILNAAARMSRLLKDLLDMARMEGGQIGLSLAVLSSAKLADQALRLVRSEAQAKWIRLVRDVSDGLAEARCDEHRILQVLINLLGNAIKFTPEGGTVTLRLEPRHQDLLFCIGDTGPGLGAEAMEHVFDRFWQAASATGEGTGLGLFIAKGIVEAHGGHIWVESVIGLGSRFCFTLPRTE